MKINIDTLIYIIGAIAIILTIILFLPSIQEENKASDYCVSLGGSPYGSYCDINLGNDYKRYSIQGYEGNYSLR